MAQKGIIVTSTEGVKIVKTTDLHETLVAIGRSPDVFYRDTPMLLQMLDNLEMINRRIKNVGHDPERRNVSNFKKGTVK